MFNDLNNPNNQNRPAVDDIFAETDKVPANGNRTSEIETRRVGLVSNSTDRPESTERSGGGKWLKIVLILVVISVLGLGGYLAYSKFLKSSDVPASTPAENKVVNKATSTNKAADTGSFVPTANEQSSDDANASTTSNEEIPLIPGVNTPTTTPLASTSTPLNQLAVDSDSDGLTDAEEKLAGSNLNIIDTDNDGLSDYEEVRIYRTSPINPDSDGDKYLDGAEVKSGYNPNGPGKMSGAQ